MKFALIQRYIVRAVVPYIILAALLLTLALLAQQAGKFAELLAGAQAPLNAIEQIIAGLLPNILVFALPMATLLGTIIGFGQMNADSEIVSMRAAGVSSWRLIVPALWIGAFISCVTLFLGFEVAPASARLLRDEVFNIALAKLQSPIQPRSFNTSLPGKVVYVRGVDEARREWERVFVFSQENANSFSVSTARNGRIDATQTRSELVLSDVSVENVQGWGGHAGVGGAANITGEHSAQLRLRLSNDAASIGRARERTSEPDELNWGELRMLAHASDRIARRAAQIALHKRLTLCVAPLAFAFLGGAFGCAARYRSGRSGGLLLGLLILLAYYLMTLAAEQMARGGMLPAYAVWSGIAAALGCGALAMRFDRQGAWFAISARRWRRQRTPNPPPIGRRVEDYGALKGALTGLLDRMILRSLALNFILAFLALIGLMQIFTLFELLRYVSINAASGRLVARYLFFLTPMLCVAVAPLVWLVASITTYSLLVRRSEAIAWLAAGQSLYRLTLPSLLFALALSILIWETQEKVLPFTNRVQDQLRQQIRGQDVSRTITPTGRLWLASADGRRLYTYALPGDADRAAAPIILQPTLFELDAFGGSLRRLVRGEIGTWEGDGRLSFKQVDLIEFGGGTVEERHLERVTLGGDERPDDFKQSLNSAAYLDTRRLSELAGLLKRRGEELSAIAYLVALQRRFADLVSPFVVTLLSVPLAFWFGRRGTLVALAVSVCGGLIYWGTISGFNQLGLYRIVPPVFAAWSPPLIFFAVGAYLLARART